MTGNWKVGEPPKPGGHPAGPQEPPVRRAGVMANQRAVPSMGRIDQSAALRIRHVLLAGGKIGLRDGVAFLAWPRACVSWRPILGLQSRGKLAEACIRKKGNLFQSRYLHKLQRIAVVFTKTSATIDAFASSKLGKILKLRNLTGRWFHESVSAWNDHEFTNSSTTACERGASADPWLRADLGLRHGRPRSGQEEPDV